MQKSGSAGRGRAGPLPQTPSNYFITQVFIAFAEQPQIPLILRVDENCEVSALIQQALTKYSESLNEDPNETAVTSYAPPSTASADYILRVAQGDGTPDNSAPQLDRNAPMREQGLVFPYMVVLSLDPNKDPADMQLTERYKAAKFQRAGRSTSPDPLASALSSLNLAGSPTPHQLFREKVAMKAFHDQLFDRNKLEERRETEVQRIEREQEERDRQHLEDCERKERERRRKMVEQRRAEEARQFEFMEEQHRMEMARRMEELANEQEKKEALEKHQKELERMEQERQRRHAALERERLRRLEEKERAKEQEEVERQKLRQMDREERLSRTLNTIIDDLEVEITMDTRARLEMLDQERQEREAQERTFYEQQYIAKVERQRKLQKEQETMQRLAKEERRGAEALAKARLEEEARKMAEEEEMERFEVWRTKRRMQLEKTYREQELDIINTIAADNLPSGRPKPSRQLMADSL